MKIIHGIKWSDAELDAYLRIIRGNFVNGMQECLQIASNVGKKLQPANLENEKHVTSLRARTVDLTPDLLDRLVALWKDPTIQEVVEKHQEQLTITHLPYFFENVTRITQADYKPTDEDILRCRQRTAGASSASVYIDKIILSFLTLVDRNLNALNGNKSWPNMTFLLCCTLLQLMNLMWKTKRKNSSALRWKSLDSFLVKL